MTGDDLHLINAFPGVMTIGDHCRLFVTYQVELSFNLTRYGFLMSNKKY